MKRNSYQIWRMVNLHWAALFLCAMMMTGCAAKFHLSPSNKQSNVLETPLRFVSLDSALFLEGTQLTLPGKVVEYAYHHPTRKLLIRYGDDLQNQEFVLYDLTKHQVQWTIKSNAGISFLKEKVAILHFDGPKILDAVDGHFLRNGEPGLWTTDREDMLLSLTDSKYARIDILSGTELWQRPGSKSDGYRWAIISDSGWVYVVANGLQVFNIQNDKTWVFATSTTSKAVGKEVAKHAGLAILGALTGTIPTADWNPDMTHNLCSYPFFMQGRIYFAARDNFYCFDRQTGKIIWQTKTKQEFGSLIVSPVGPYMAVIGEGWKYRNYGVIKALPPVLQLFEKDSGEPVALFSSDSSDVALSYRWTENEAYFLTSTRLYRLDHKLNVLGVLNASTEWGQFIRILATDKLLTIRTSEGVLALDGASLEVRWHKKLGSEKLRVDLGSNFKWREGVMAMLVKAYEGKGNWHMEDREWLLSSNGLAAVDLKNAGKLVMEIPFTGKNFEMTDNGIFFFFDENRLSLVDMNKIAGKTKVILRQ